MSPEEFRSNFLKSVQSMFGLPIEAVSDAYDSVSDKLLRAQRSLRELEAQHARRAARIELASLVDALQLSPRPGRLYVLLRSPDGRQRKRGKRIVTQLRKKGTK